MKIRFGTYTIYNGIEMSIMQYYGHGLNQDIDENHRKISYDKKKGILKGFKLDNKTNKFFKDIQISKLDNAFKVETKGRYKEETFLLWGYNKQRNVIGLITYDDKIAQKFNFINLSDRFLKEVTPEELDLIWEERGQSEFDLPMPNNLEKKKIIIPTL